MSPNEGRVLTAHSGLYDVLGADGGVTSCRARRRLRRPETSWPVFPVPGDVVEWLLLERSGGKSGIIEAVRPRRTEIARVRAGAKHVVVANLDRLVVVVSVRHPTFDRGLLDRLLCTAERNRIAALLCLHKIDLADPGEGDVERAVYEKAGYPMLLTSTTSGAGIEALREALRGHVSAFMGPSGAGKSHLISALQPGLSLRTGMVSEKSGQGRHTTTRVDLHRTDFGALLADTPGVREFSLWGLQPEELGPLFPEIRELQEHCRFASCTHDHEPHCAVKEAVAAGRVDAGRHRSYLAILAELRQDALAESRGGAPRRKERNA
ncbi:MAG TPA: ribosome small subunit-dependent GTPase A [Candidatus Krumholzibacteria bacterium]|nr:ribosome small subunit-dependent GTPase A [Candidatus Krumholzibacteria bacterium]